MKEENPCGISLPLPHIFLFKLFKSVPSVIRFYAKYRKKESDRKTEGT